MIASDITMRSALLNILTDPDGIKKELIKLDEREKSARKAMRELGVARSLNSYKTKIEKEIEQAKEVLEGTQKQCQELKDSTEKELHEMKEAAALNFKASKSILLEAKEKKQELIEREKEIDVTQKKVDELLVRAEHEKVKYEEFKKQYEDKLADIHNRLTGL